MYPRCFLCRRRSTIRFPLSPLVNITAGTPHQEKYENVLLEISRPSGRSMVSKGHAIIRPTAIGMKSLVDLIVVMAMASPMRIKKDAIEKQLEDSIDASEHQQLQDEVAELKDLLATSQTKCKYWYDAHNNLVESSDELANRNEDLIKQNNDLKNKFDEVNNTNQLLNQNLIATNTNFKETKEQMQSDFEKQEKELKETIEKQQSHIDELTQIKDSLLPLKDNIAQKQHYNEIGALKDEIRTKEKEISKLNNEIESKLASQKSDLSIEHANEKAQILVGFNQQLDNLKLQYNNLANDYNHLLNGVDSLTRINTFFNGKHNEIKKNKEQVPLLEITTEQLPPSDENVLEYVPKED